MSGISISNMSTNEKYSAILENTTKEMNMVLARWVESNKRTTSDDIYSLFKSLFSRYCKYYLGWKIWCKVERNHPIGIIVHNQLIGIHFGIICNDYDKIDDFRDTVNNFNFKAFKYDAPKVIIAPNFERVNVEKIIDYQRIEEIKFN